MRANNRKNDELRPVAIERGFQPQASASLLLKMGNTHVACAVTVEETVPPFLKGKGQGWITAEYGMLPCATNSRMKREGVGGRSGRTHEIQRLIGRSLRMMVDLGQIGERTLRIECDVINADGGTRTASITGAALAVRDALRGLVEKGDLAAMPLLTPVAAISAGLLGGVACLDLDYHEDSAAEVDANFVMSSDGSLIEVQSTAEGKPFSRAAMNEMTDLAAKGIGELFSFWDEA